MHGDCFLIEREGESVLCAERLAFGETAGRNEAWLRDTLFEHPQLLPVREIDSSFGPLIPLCKELRTEAGPLDIAFINPHGRLTLVECKLWRNPEARRKVVAQVLDYARAINQWSYSDLQRQVAAATGRKGNIPFELAHAIDPNLKEHTFVDDTYSAMQSGRFLLLIAGDGIREDVGAMAELINRNAASGFAFGLIEVALYGLDDGGLVVQPRTITKTKIIERNVVLVRDKADNGKLRLEDDEFGNGSGNNAARNELGESPKQAEYRAWWSPVLEMQFDDPDQEPPVLYYPNNIRAPLPIPKTWLLAYRLGGEKGKIGVCTAGSAPNYSQMIESLRNQKVEILAELPTGSEFRKFLDNSDNYTFSTVRNATEFDSEDDKRKWVSETLNTYVNVFRPRIKYLS